MDDISTAAVGLIPLDAELLDFSQVFSLSSRETEILRLLLSGIVSANEIAQALQVSPNTVNNHLGNIFDKAGASSKAELIATFVRHMLIQLNHCKLFTSRPKVLIVDDEPDVSGAIGDFLRNRGVQVWIETDPQQVINTIRSIKLDFVIADIAMPKIDGLELLKKIRDFHPTTPKVLLITGRQGYSVEICLDLGAVDFLTKPLHPERLFFAIMDDYIDRTYQYGNPQVDQLGNSSPTCLESEKIYAGTPHTLGFGGMFIPFATDSKEPERQLKVGEHIRFQLKLDNLLDHVLALAKVVWRRAEPGPNLRAGLGVKFLELPYAATVALEELVYHHKIKSYIPRGSVPG